jgi:imidazolonepropionase-like amidohydrolase
VLLAVIQILLGAQAAAQRSPPARQSLVIRNVRIFDGKKTIPQGDVWVENGKIRAVGANLKVPAGVPSRGASGDTLLPGLIDAHTHTYTEGMLRAALVFGVTTELDMFTSVEFTQKIKKDEAAGKDMDLASFYSTQTLVTALGGHGTEYGMNISTITAPADAQAFVDARIAEGSDYIKIIYDDGSAYGLDFPTLSRQTLAAVIDAAYARGKLAVIHIGSQAGARDAVEANADGLMHIFEDTSPAPAFAALVVKHGAFVVPTLSVNESVSGAAAGAPLVADSRLAPYILPDDVANLNCGFPVMKKQPDFQNALAAVRQLNDAHVLLLAGTDAPNPGTARGASMHGELELLVKADLSPSQALAAGTANPAKAFHLNDRGTIAVGQRADLLLVKGDPITDITATRDIVAVWKGGIEVNREAYRTEIQAIVNAQETVPAGSESGLVSDFDGGNASAKYGSGWAVSTDQMHAANRKPR